MAGLLARTRSADTVLEGRRGRLVPAVEIAILPLSLLEAFVRADDDRQGWGRLLRFLSPIAIAGGMVIEVSR